MQIVNGTLFEDMDSAAATYGNLFGKLIGIALPVLAGVFLVRFDRICKLNYIDGLKKRGKQCTTVIVFLVIYTVLTLLSFFAVGPAIVENDIDGLVNIFIFTVITMAPYVIGLVAFCEMLIMYVFPYSKCKKNFNYNDAMLNYFISGNEAFGSYTQDNKILASGKALFFPNYFCIIPFDQIGSTKQDSVPWEQDITFILTNGKKIRLVFFRKVYDNILAAINANTDKSNVK